MDKNQRYILAIIGILALCIAVNMTKGTKKRKPLQLSVQDTLDYFSPYISSKSFDQIATIATRVPDEQLIKALTKMMRDKDSLNHEEKVRLILAVAEKNRSVRTKLFTLLKEYFSMYRPPILYLAVVHNYPQVIQDLKSWLLQTDPAMLESWAAQAFDYALINNNLLTLERLFMHGIRPISLKATELLHQVVQTNKAIAFVPFLVKKLQADVNYVDKDKRTILMRAVENGNKPMVQILLESGAQAEALTDPTLGTAKHIAFKRGFIDIQRLLQDYTRY